MSLDKGSKSNSNLSSNATRGTVFSSDDNHDSASNCEPDSTFLEPAGQLTSTVQGKKRTPKLHHGASPILPYQQARRSERLSKRLRSESLESISEESSLSVEQPQLINLYRIFKYANEDQISELAATWIQELFDEEKQILAYDSFMSVFLQCAGFEDPELPTNYNGQTMKKYTKKLEKDLWNEDTRKLSCDIFSSHSKLQKIMSGNFRSFVMHSIVMSSKQQECAQQLLEFLLLIIENFRMSSSMKLKRTCAALTTSTIGGVIQTLFYLVSLYEKLEHLKEPEEAKPSYEQDKELLANLYLQMDILHDANKGYENIVAQLLGAIFSDFTRAKEGSIVAECLHYLSIWMMSYPSIFLTPSYLVVIMRVLPFPDVSVRIESLLCLKSIFAIKCDEELVQHCYNESKEILYLMTQDQNLTVAQLAISVIGVAYRNWEKLVPRKHIESIYKLIYCENKTLSQAAGQILWYTMNNMAISNDELLIGLAEFHCEAQMPKQNLQRLVDAIFPWDKEGILVDWNRMTTILLDKQIQENYNINDEELLAFTQIMIHLVRKSVTGKSQVTDLYKPCHNVEKVLSKMENCQKKVTTTFVKHLPNLFNRHATNRDIITELVSLPQYYVSECNVTIPASVQNNLEEFLEFLNILVMSDNTDEATFVNCVATIYILLKNDFLLDITKPKIEETLQELQKSILVIFEDMTNELKSISNEEVSISEYCIQNLEPKLLKSKYMFHYFGLPECREVVWDCVILILSSFTSNEIDWGSPRLQMILESAVQVCRLILIHLYTDATQNSDLYEAKEKYSIFLEQVLDIFELLLPDHQNIIKFEACEAFLQVTVVFNKWGYIQSNEVLRLLKFLKEYIFVEPKIPCEEMNAEEKYHHKRKRDIVGKLCDSISSSYCGNVTDLRLFIYSQQIECEQVYLYDNIVETYLKLYLGASNSHEFVRNTLEEFLQEKFKDCTRTGDMKIEPFEKQAKAWSLCVPNNISKKELCTLHLEGIDFASRFDHGWFFLRGLRYFSCLLKNTNLDEIVKELGVKIQEQNLTVAERECVHLYKESLIAVQKHKGKRTRADEQIEDYFGNLEMQPLPYQETTTFTEDVSASNNEDENLNISEHPPELDEEPTTLTEENAARDGHENSTNTPDYSYEELSQENSQTSLEMEQNESEREEQNKKHARLASKLKKQLDKKWMNSSSSTYSTRSATRKKKSSTESTLSSIDENSEIDIVITSKSDRSDSLSKDSVRMSSIQTRSRSRSRSIPQSNSSNSSITSE